MQRKKKKTLRTNLDFFYFFIYIYKYLYRLIDISIKMLCITSLLLFRCIYWKKNEKGIELD